MKRVRERVTMIQKTVWCLRALNILTGAFIATTIVMGALLTYGLIE